MKAQEMCFVSAAEYGEEMNLFGLMKENISALQ